MIEKQERILATIASANTSGWPQRAKMPEFRAGSAVQCVLNRNVLIAGAGTTHISAVRGAVLR